MPDAMENPAACGQSHFADAMLQPFSVEGYPNEKRQLVEARGITQGYLSRSPERMMERILK
jgi:hypothetical protein